MPDTEATYIQDLKPSQYVAALHDEVLFDRPLRVLETDHSLPHVTTITLEGRDPMQLDANSLAYVVPTPLDARFPLVSRTIHITLPITCDDDRANELLARLINEHLDYALRGFTTNLTSLPELAGTSTSLLRVEVTS